MPNNKILFLGSKSLGLETVKTIHRISHSSLIGIITIDDSKDSRSELLEFKNFAEKNDINFYIVKNREELNNLILDLNPDLCIVVCWYWIIPKNILKKVKGGFIGVHNSLLPKYRGGSPLVWQLINGETSVGFSVFTFTEGMDEGDIWGKAELKIGNQDYIGDVLKRIENEIILWFENNFESLITNRINPIPQSHEIATFCAQRFPFDGKIDWSKSAEKVYNFIRAQSNPYPGAFSYLLVEKLIIWTASLPNVTFFGEHGQVAKITSEGVWVICGDNKPIRLEKVQLEGREITDSYKIIKSVKTRLS